MSRYKTLTQLNDFLEANKLKERQNIRTEEDYINQKPNDLVMNGHTSLEENIKENINKLTTEHVAYMINELAKIKGESYAEMCLELLEKGSEITPLLKGGGVLTTWLSANRAAYNIIRNSIKKKIEE